MFSSSQAEQFRAPRRSRVSSSGHFEGPSRAERARSRKRRQVQCFLAARPSNFERPGRVERVRAAISSAPAEPSGLERPFRAPQRSRAGSSGYFERPSGAERARSRKRRQVRCFRGRPSRVKLRTASGASKRSYGNLSIDIYIIILNELPGLPATNECQQVHLPTGASNGCLQRVPPTGASRKRVARPTTK